MPTEVLRREVRDGLVLLTFNRERTLNSMTAGFVEELMATLHELARDDATRVIVLTGSGRGFSSGHALDEIDEGGQQEWSVQRWMADQEAFSMLMQQIASQPQPVIAAINGPAVGGGLAMALASDIRVCSVSATFGVGFVRLGISGCDVGVSYHLPRVAGPTLAFEMMLTGRIIDADEAQRAGIVLDVHPEGEVVDAALSIAERILANSPFAIRMTTRVMRANAGPTSLDQAIALEDRTQILCAQTVDHREALEAFLEKRQPRWVEA